MSDVTLSDEPPQPEPDPSGELDEFTAAPDLDTETEAPEPPKTGWRAVREWVIVIAIALTVAVVIRMFVIAPFYIPSDSMYDTLQTHDRILVNKLSYHLHPVHRGDVVVFSKPPNFPAGDDKIEDLIKRVIGLPGDTISIINCVVSVNGQVLSEPYADGQCTQPASTVVDADGDGSFTVPAGDYFVMGDNRRPDQSYDSRFWGYVTKNLIVGRAFVVIWPKGHWRWL